MKGLLKSFGHGFRGIGSTFKTERNFRLHVISSVLAIGFGIWLKISVTEWIAVVLSIGVVMAAEAMNTGLEALADAVHPDENRLIGKAKDAGAAAVLLTSIAACVVGVIVFLPKLWRLLNPVIENQA